MTSTNNASEALEKRIKSLETRIEGSRRGLFIISAREMYILVESLDLLREQKAHLDIREGSWVDGAQSGMEVTA